MSKENKSSNQQQVMYYMQLRQQGMSGPQAFQMAFPQGLQNQGPTPEEMAKEQQKAGLGQIAGMTGGALGTYYLVDALSGGASAASALPSVAGAAGAAAPATPTLISASAIPQAGTSGVAGTAGTVGAEGAATTLGAAAPYLGLAGAGLGAYGLYGAIEDNNKGAGALSGAALGGGLAAAAPLVGLGPVGWGGLALAAALGAGGGFGLTSLLGHESTRDVAKKHTGQLQGMGKDDAAWQNYVQGMRAQHASAAPDPSKPFHGGQYGSWDEYKNAGLDAADLTGVYGNLKTFGPEWAKLSFDDRKKVTQGVIDAGLYNSKKGEVEISDADRALQIRDSILNGGNTMIPRALMGQPMRPVARPTPGNMPQQPTMPTGQPQQLQQMPYPGVQPMPRPMVGAQAATRLPQVQPNNINMNPQQIEQMRKFGLKLVGALGQR